MCDKWCRQVLLLAYLLFLLRTCTERVDLLDSVKGGLSSHFYKLLVDCL